MMGKPANVAIDTTKKELAFIWKDKIKTLQFDKIVEWQHKWTEVNTTRNGRHYHGLNDNKLVFTVKDIDNPLIKISVKNHPYGEEWSAKFSLILKG